MGKVLLWVAQPLGQDGVEGAKHRHSSMNGEDYPEHHPRVSEHQDFTHMGLTGTFSPTALNEELMGFLSKI